MELSQELRESVSASLAEEWGKAAIGKELAGSNQHFAIRPCFAVTQSGDPFLVYGVFNRTTEIREAETVQYAAAKQWVEALTRISRGEPMPGLGVVEASGPANTTVQ